MLRLVDVGHGVRLSVQDVGVGTPVVFVAGFGMDHQVWDRQVRLLAVDHRVICLNQRGHGRSDAPLSGYDVESLSSDLLTVLEQLDVIDCTLVGWSFGGQVAFRACAREQRRIARLALVGSNAVRASRSDEFPFGRTAESLEPVLVAAEHSARHRARRQTITSGFYLKLDDDIVDWLLAISLQMPSWAAVQCYHSMLYTDLIKDMPDVTVPVLQIVGAADPVHSAKGARWLCERLSSATLVELPGCGHYPMLEAPDLFDDALLAFISAQ